MSLPSDTPDISSLNAARHALRERWRYSPVTGDPHDPSRLLECGSYLPRTMLADPAYSPSLRPLQMDLLRFRHDFEYWCFRCIRITDKDTMLEIPFTLNAPQRRLVMAIEAERRAGHPLRLIMLKARQWGGSTLVQVYFAWIQIIHRRGWNSLICAHVKDSAANIRAMYARLLAGYPEQYWEEAKGRPELRPFERMTNTRFIPGRDCRVTVCSAEAQEAARGIDCAMAHLSEVAFWKDSLRHTPEDMIRSVTSGIQRKPLSFVALESTANGTGNYFHREWLRAVSPKGSDKVPFFVPWFEIDLYSEPVPDADALWAELDDYERRLFLDNEGCTLEGIAWYHHKRREYQDHRSMMAEYPSTPAEAFSATDTGVFAPAHVERLREAGCTVTPRRGEVEWATGSFVESAEGLTEVWAPPRPDGDYIVAVDIGGRTRLADWSVISVLDRGGGARQPEIAAQWRGHIDHDLLAWKAAAMARWYGQALLVIESNTLESDAGGEGPYILDTLAGAYPRLYRRPSGTDGTLSRPGFHTNRATKAAIIANLVAFVREGLYIERSSAACDELLQYELTPSGTFAAARDCHDDILMTRAIALYIHVTQPPAPPSDIVRELLAIRWG